jgi:two-component system, cell cycle response regulator DivK
MISYPDLRVGQTCVTPARFAPSTQPVALVIDDSKDCQQIATYVLKQLGCRCWATSTAAEGLSFAIALAPDIIILDAVLPDFSGLEFFQHFKQHDQAALAAVVAVTASADPVDQERWITTGCFGYLRKPYLLQDLINILRPYLAAIPQQSTQAERFADIRFSSDETCP